MVSWCHGTRESFSTGRDSVSYLWGRKQSGHAERHAGVLLAYLEARLGHQIDYFKQVDTKVHVRVLVCVGLVVLLVPLLPLMPKLWTAVYQKGGCELVCVAGTLLLSTAASLAFFVASLCRTLWLALEALDVTVAFPSTTRANFEQVATAEDVRAADVLRELTVNCVKAVDLNAQLIEERHAKGNALVVTGDVGGVDDPVRVACIVYGGYRTRANCGGM